MDKNKMDDITRQVQDVLGFRNYFEPYEKEGKILGKSCKNSTEARDAGNKLYRSINHDDDTHKNAFLYYSKSIAFAPINSEELALGYGNRSALLFHLQKYEECLIDIDRAYKLSQSIHLKAKLEDRRSKCLKLIDELNTKKISEQVMNNSSKNDIQSKLPDTVLSEIVQSAADCVTLNYNKQLGRHLIATKNIKAGDIVVIEEAFALVSEQHLIYVVCSHCLKIAWNGIPCDFCAFAIFCSEGCKEKAWTEYHDVECAMTPFYHCNSVTYRTDVVTAARIFIRAVKKEGFSNIKNQAEEIDKSRDLQMKEFLVNGKFDSDKFRSFYNLIGYPKIDNGFYEMMIIYLLYRYTNLLEHVICYKVRALWGEGVVFIKNMLIKSRDIIRLNSFSYTALPCSCPDTSQCTSNCYSDRGVGIFPLSSLINHSCAANINKIFLPSRKVVFFARHPIKQGEQLCDSYGPTITEPKSLRQTFLKNQFRFDCMCVACKNNWPTTDLEDWNSLSLLKKQACSGEFMDKETREYLLSWDETISTEYNEVGMMQAIQILDVLFKHYDYYKAFLYGYAFIVYIEKSFHHLHGEKYHLLSKC